MNEVELTKQAREILKTATAGDGTVEHNGPNIGTPEHIEAGGRVVAKNDAPRDFSYWLGGLEDLQRLGYIARKDFGDTNGYRVTREGYEVDV